MKMNKINLIFLVVLGFSLFSCFDSKKEGFIQNVDKLIKKLDSLEKEIVIAEIDTIASWQQNANSVELRIKNNLYLDKVDLVFGRKMDDYKRMRRMLNPLNRNFIKIKEAIKEEKNVLANLRMDIENGAGKRDKYSEYIAFEKGKIRQIQLLIEDYLNTRKEALEIHNRLHNELNSFSLSLLKK